MFLRLTSPKIVELSDYRRHTAHIVEVELSDDAYSVLRLMAAHDGYAGNIQRVCEGTRCQRSSGIPSRNRRTRDLGNLWYHAAVRRDRATNGRHLLAMNCQQPAFLNNFVLPLTG